DQVQTFYPSPMAMATAMYYSGKDPLHKVTYKSKSVNTPKTLQQRRFQKALLRFHDESTWGLLREEFRRMGRPELIGNGPGALIPDEKPSRQRPARERNRVASGKKRRR